MEYNTTKAAVWQEDKTIQTWINKCNSTDHMRVESTQGIILRSIGWREESFWIRVWQAKLKSTDPFSIDLPSSTDCVGSDLS
jgi:hypothetical protein